MKLVTNSFLFCFICLISISIKSQNVTANIESDSILIGKELLYTIDIDMEKAENIIFPDSTSFIPFELISETKVDTTEKVKDESPVEDASSTPIEEEKDEAQASTEESSEAVSKEVSKEEEPAPSPEVQKEDKDDSDEKKSEDK